MEGVIFKALSRLKALSLELVYSSERMTMKAASFREGYKLLKYLWRSQRRRPLLSTIPVSVSSL